MDAYDMKLRATRPLLYDKANQVLAHMPATPGVRTVIDPASIMAIINLITQLWQCWQDRKKAKANVNRPNFLQRLKLRRAVKQHLGPDKASQYGDAVTDGLLEMGKHLTESDIATMLAELEKDPNA